MDVCRNHVNDKKNLPEQLKRSEDHDKIKGLHIEGKSNQTHEGKDCHKKVEPGHVVRWEHRSRTLNNHLTQSPSHYSQIPARAEISHWPQPRNLQQHLYAINWKEEDKKLLLSSSLHCWQFVWGRNMEGSTLTCQKNNVTPGNNFGPRKSICNRTQKKWSVLQNIFLQHLCSKAAQDRTVEHVRLQEDPHPVDGHHHIWNRWRKTFISASLKTAVRKSNLTLTHGILEGLRLHKQMDT